MGDQGPLAGKRIVVTRALEQAAELAGRLEQLGAEVFYMPAVRFEPPLDCTSLDAALRNLVSYEWLILTSQNAARFVYERLNKLCSDAGAPSGGQLKVAAVGEATAAVAKAAGFNVEFVASRYQGRALAEELGERVKGRRVLLPRSDRARPDLPAALRAAGAEVTEAIAYRTLDEDLRRSAALKEAREGRVDVLMFASPSAFNAMAEAMGADELRQTGERAVIAAIGPVTADAIREAGLVVHVTADESSAAGLSGAIAEYFEGQRVKLGAAAR